jgi:hypothetical protein
MRHRVGRLKQAFKDSAVKETRLSSKDSTFPRSRNDGNLARPRVSTVRIRWLEKCPFLLGFSHVAIRWRRGRDSNPVSVQLRALCYRGVVA